MNEAEDLRSQLIEDFGVSEMMDPAEISEIEARYADPGYLRVAFPEPSIPEGISQEWKAALQEELKQYEPARDQLLLGGSEIDFWDVFDVTRFKMLRLYAEKSRTMQLKFVPAELCFISQSGHWNGIEKFFLLAIYQKLFFHSRQSRDPSFLLEQWVELFDLAARECDLDDEYWLRSRLSIQGNLRN